jgi:hypothetical protein
MKEARMDGNDVVIHTRYYVESQTIILGFIYGLTPSLSAFWPWMESLT